MCGRDWICLLALLFILRRAHCIIEGDTDYLLAVPMSDPSTLSDALLDLNAEAGAMLRAEEEAKRVRTNEADVFLEEKDSAVYNETMTMMSTLSPEVQAAYPQAGAILSWISHVYEGKATSAFYLDSNDKGREEAAKESNDSSAHVYGELLPQSVLKLFTDLGIKSNSKYYDLGSGTGKTVMLASRCGLDATGIELVEGRYKEACSRLSRVTREKQTYGHAKFFWASFLEQDFSDADIIFTDSVLFSAETMNGLANVAKFMKPGSYLVSAKGIPQPDGCGDCFQDVKTLDLAVTWTNSYTWHIQTVTENAFNMKRSQSSLSVSNSKKEFCNIEATRQSGAQWTHIKTSINFETTAVVERPGGQ